MDRTARTVWKDIHITEKEKPNTVQLQLVPISQSLHWYMKGKHK